MALLKFAAEIVGMRGHASGLIFSANKAGPYAKPFAAPVNKNSALQQAQRSTLTTVAHQWRAISSAQREDWDDFAAAPPETDYDPWGEVVYLSGQQWFNRINLRLTSAGSALVDDPPTATPQTPVSIASLVAHDYLHPNADSYLSFAAASFSDGSLPVITAALVYSQGLAAPSNRYMLLSCGPTTSGSSVLLGTLLKTAFGDYPEDTLLFATLARQSTTGIRSTQTTKSTVVLT